MLFVLPCNTSNYPLPLFLQSPSYLIKAKYEAPSSVNDTKPVSLVSIVVPLKIVNCVIQAVITVSLEEEWAHLHFQDVFPPTDVWKTSLDFSAYHPFRPSLLLLPTTCSAIQYFFPWFSLGHSDQRKEGYFLQKKQKKRKKKRKKKSKKQSMKKSMVLFSFFLKIFFSWF